MPRRRTATPVKALLGDAEPEVIGQCFFSLLSLDTRDPVQFVGRFLNSKDQDIRLEAACALALSRDPQAIETLRSFWKQRLPPELRRAVLVSLGSSTLAEAADFLLSIVADESAEHAAQALSALAASRFSAAMRERIASIIETKRDSSLRQLFEQRFAKAGGNVAARDS